jgi:hypothetical protein
MQFACKILRLDDYQHYTPNSCKELDMLEKRTKMFVLIFLLFLLLVTGILITSGRVGINSPKTPSKNGQAPIRKVDITLAQNQHDQLFDQLRKFADKHAFAIRIARTDPSGENFLVQMWREDIKVIAVDSGDPGLFKIGFYNTYEERPVPTRVFDELIDDLRGFIAEIPNTTFTVKE